MNNIKFLNRNRRTISNIINTPTKTSIKLPNPSLIKKKEEFLKNKLDNILSPETKEYIDLDKQLKKERELKFKLKNYNHTTKYTIKHTKNYSSIFWGVYGSSLFS